MAESEQRPARFGQYRGASTPEPAPRGGRSRTNNVLIVILSLILVAIVVVGILVVGAIALFLRTPGSLKEPSSSGAATETTATATTPQCPPGTWWDATHATCATLAPGPSATPQETEQDRVRAVQEAARRAKQAKADAQQRECDKFQKDPNAFLRATETRYYDRGIVRGYRQLSGIRVINQSKYCAVYDIHGTVEWFDANGASLGTTNFSLDRTINAGDTEPFSMTDGSLTSGTIAGAATSGNVKFTSASVGYMCLQPDNECPAGMFCGQPGYCMAVVK